MTKTREVPHAAIPIPLTAIRESRTNPRRTFDKDAMADLTESVKKHGVLQPVLVRPDRKNGSYELVAGARRLRAAKIAGLEEIVATVRELTDVEALEIQVIENLQREDLHPVEEAEGYRILQEKHGYAVEDLAAKVGKSKAYVYGRMKLTALAPAARRLFRDGRFEVSHAFLIARIPVPELQEKAAKEVCHAGWGRAARTMSIHETRNLIERKYMMQLREAPFDPKDAELVPSAGPCGSCPKRTGNDRDLFGDVKAANMCTDPTCFEAKTKANVKRVLDEAQASGEPVLAGKKAERLLYGNTYIELDNGGDEVGWKKWRTALGRLVKDLPVQRILIAGRIHELVPRKDAIAALKKGGKIKKSMPAPHSAATSAFEKKRKLIKKVATECLGDVAEKAERVKNAKRLMRLVVEHLLRGRAAPLKLVAKRRETPELERDYRVPMKPANRLLDRFTEAELRGLAVELIAADGIEWAGDRFPHGFVGACKFAGVNHQARHRAAVKAAAGKKAVRKKKPKAKAKRKRSRKAARK